LSPPRYCVDPVTVHSPVGSYCQGQADPELRSRRNKWVAQINILGPGNNSYSAAMAQLQVLRQRIDGIEDMRRVLGEPHINCVPLGADTPTGAIFRASIGDIFLRAGELSADIRTRSSIESDLLSFAIKLDSPGRLFSFRSGEEALPGDVFRLARGDVNDYRVTGHMRFAVISLRPDLLVKHGADDTVQGDRSVWERHQWFRASLATRASA